MKSRDTAALLWLSVVLMITLSIAFLLPVSPHDYWWYLRIGRDTLASGAVPRLDTLTFSQAGTPVTYHSWGAAILFWVVYRLGGLPLTVLLRGLLLVATCIPAWATARRAGAGRLGASLILLAAMLTSSNNWSLRPQLFAYPLFALALFILYKWQDGDKQVVWGLPFISLLWVNLHGSFVILILLTGAAVFFGRGDRRSLILAFAGVLLATLVNPRGPGAWTYVVNSLTNRSIQQFSAEWLPPVNAGWQMNIFFLWLLVFPLLVVLGSHKPSRLEWIWFLGFGALALSGERHVIWFIFILVVLSSRLVVDWENKYLAGSNSSFPALNLTLSLFLILLPLALLPGLREKWWKQGPADTENTPIAATSWVAAHSDLPGPLWSEIGFSSYLEFALPQRPTWIDTRFEVFPVNQWQDYKAINDARYDWSGLLGASGANLLMVSKQIQPDLLSALKNAPGWCLLYSDNVAAIFRSCGGAQ